MAWSNSNGVAISSSLATPEGWWLLSMYYIRCITSGMAQPKNPPISIRMPPEMLAGIDAMAERKGMKRHAAILWALALGEAADRGITPQSTLELAKVVAAFPREREPQTITEIMARERNKPRVHVELPIHKPRAFNPQPKRGKP